MQRLREGQQVLVQVNLKMAICTLAGFSDGAAVLRLTDRQHGGPLPADAHDVQLTFEHESQLVLLNGRIRRRGDEELLFSVRDSVQIPPRRRDSRLKARLPAHVRLSSGEEFEASTADVSASGMSIEGALPVRRGDAVTVRLTLPEGAALTVAVAASVVRAGRSVTALRIEGFDEGDRDRLESYVFAAVASDESSKPS
jgi:PilZ domain